MRRSRAMEAVGYGLMCVGGALGLADIYTTAQALAYDNAAHMVSGEAAYTSESLNPDIDAAAVHAAHEGIVLTATSIPSFVIGGAAVALGIRRRSN